MWKEFKKFAAKGNVIDMAVGIIIGAAFGSVVKSLVADVIMPPIGLLLGNVDFTNIFLTLKEGATPGPYVTLADASRGRRGHRQPRSLRQRGPVVPDRGISRLRAGEKRQPAQIAF